MALLAGFGWLLLFGWEGLFLIQVLGLASLPFALVGLIASLIFARQIVDRPWPWAICGALLVIGLGLLAMFAITGTAVGLLALMVAPPVAVLFPVVLKLLLSA